MSEATSQVARGRSRWVVGALAVLAFLTVVSLARPLRPPRSPRAVSHALGAASVARDFDLRFEGEDMTRFRDFVALESLGLVLAGGDKEALASFPGSPFEMIVVAPFVRLAGLRGALFAHALALALAMGLAARTLHQRIDSNWRILWVCLLASILLPFVLEPRSEVLVLSAVVAAFALAYRGETPRFEELPEVFGEKESSARLYFAGRWLAVGALLTFAAWSHPIYLLLFVPGVLAIPPAARSKAGAVLALGAVATAATGLLLVLLLGGAMPWGSQLAHFTSLTGFPGLGGEWSGGVSVPSTLAAARPVADIQLLGWNVLFLALGRGIGAIPYLLPLILLLALWEPRSGRSVLVATATVAAIASIVIWPFDYVGDTVGLGNALMLPFFGALWLVPTRRCSLWAPAAVLVASGLMLWPTWLYSVGLWAGGPAPGSLISPIASRWLPHESSLRPMASDYVTQGGLRVLPAGGEVSTRRSRLFLIGERWGNLVIASPEPLQRAYLAFDGQAGSNLEVVGGALGNTVFRGDGGVGFEIDLEERSRRHLMWWSPERQSLYDLRLRLPDAPRVPVAFGVEGD